jgi:hypothetical protein
MDNIVPSQFGSILHMKPGNPAAGADYNFSASIPGRYLITAINFQLVTSAAVADRNPTCYIGIGSDYFVRLHTSAMPHSASSTVTYWFAQGLLYAGSLARNYCFEPMPANIMMSGAISFSTATLNIQAADQFSALNIWGLIWLEPTD